MRLRALVVVALLLGACGDGSTSEPEDILAESACEKFRIVADDVRAGVLTDSELRERLKDIYDEGRFADNKEIADASERMLAAVTTGTEAEGATAVEDMDAACTAAGF